MGCDKATRRDNLTLVVTDSWMLFRRVPEPPPPHGGPERTDNPENPEGQPPSGHRHQPGDRRQREGRAQTRTRKVDALCEAAFRSGQPTVKGARARWKRPRLSSAEQETHD